MKSANILGMKRIALPSWLPRALFESFLIVLSVLLALVLNGWRDSSEQQARIDQALGAIQAEITENLRLIEQAGQYHSRLEQGFKTAVAEEATLPDLSIVDRGLMAPAPVTKTAWESAQDIGIASVIPYESLLSLSRVYEQHTQYQQINQVMTMQIYTALMERGLDEVLSDYGKLIPLLHDNAVREQELANAYAQALEEFHQQGSMH